MINNQTPFDKTKNTMSDVAERFGITETIELFFIGDDYYSKSRTIMSPIYVVGSGKRFDWGFVNCMLRKGKSVHIRPATQEELDCANKKLSKIVSEDDF